MTSCKKKFIHVMDNVEIKAYDRFAIVFFHVKR